MQPVFIFFLLFSQGQMTRIKFVNIIKVEKSNERLLPFLMNVYRPGLNPYQIKLLLMFLGVDISLLMAS